MTEQTELFEIAKKLVSLSIDRLVEIIIILYVANLIKGLVRGIAIRIWLYFNRNLIEDRIIKVNEAQGKIKRMGFWETKIENEEMIFFVPNEYLLKSIKGFPILRERNETNG